ncbi:uncharacterized protein LOC114845794 [Betta splendens]|uniref:Uncharacterized protein LOC114845794 n=1 Tax=Betta splendens TaxID=158456 RepID=A0A6P7L9W1_BETSP|nr:uncharacterized protein LOC114845794 [Betta splendens]
MARSGRPASESFQPSGSAACQSSTVGREDDDDHAPIFSLSKSSMDVVAASGPSSQRDPVWSALDLRRSLSTNTPSDPSSAALHRLRPHAWQRKSASHSLQLPLAAPGADTHAPPAPGERWSACSACSACSDGTLSRSSTPDTVVCAGASRPSSLGHDASESPLSKVTSPSSTPSPFISPLCTPPAPAGPTPTTPSTDGPGAQLASSPGPSPGTRNSSSFASNAEDEGFLENNVLFFQFPSPIPSLVNVAEGGGSIEHKCFVKDSLEPLSEAAAASPEPELSSMTPSPPAGEEAEAPVCGLQLPWQPEQSCWTGRAWKSPLVSSLSDSRLDDVHRIKLHTGDGATKDPKAEVFRQREMVDAAVQTVSPVCSWWDLKRNMDSHSLLGSPPGSRLNLKSSVGSSSNLVSPSSSMFPVSSGEEEERAGDNPTWDINSASVQDLERRRSCLKMQADEADELGRRSSMKQVQWDEDGVRWDAHGASVDPEVLNTAILKHLELQNSPQAPRKSSKKKKAPRPPLLLNAVKATAPELGPPVATLTSACVVEDDSEETPEADGGTEMEEGGRKKEAAGTGGRMSRAEDSNTKDDEEEVYGEEGSIQPSPRGSGPTRKRSVIRSLRPGWCGGRKAED